MTCRLRHDDLVVDVDAPAPQTRELVRLLAPAFGDAPDALAEVSVSLAVEAALPLAGSTIERRVAFTFDSGPMRLPEEVIDGGARLRHPGARLVFDVTEAGRRTLLRCELGVLDTRVWLMRVAREYAHNRALDRGGVVLHAAAVVFGGVAVAVAGPKGAGKTTLALQWLGGEGVGYLANDRVLVYPGWPPRAVSVPTVMAIRAGTRELMPDFTRALGPLRVYIPTTDPGSGALGDTWYAAPHRVAAALTREMHREASLAAIVLLDREGMRPGEMRRMREGEAARALFASLVGATAGCYSSEVFVSRRDLAPDGEELYSRCAALAAQVRCYRAAPAENIAARRATLEALAGGRA